MEDEEIKLFQTEKDIGIESQDGTIYFSFLKSNIESPAIPKEHIKSTPPYTVVDKNVLLDTVDVLTSGITTAVPTGIKVIVSGSGDSASLDLKLLATLESEDTITCKRVDEKNEEVTHIIDYLLLRTILRSFETDQEIRLHINEDKTFFKMYNSGEVGGHKYLLAAVGAYSRVVN